MKKYISAVFAHLIQPLNLFITLSVSALLAFAGPFGTFETLSASLRIAYWGTVVVAAVIIVTFLKIAIEMWLSHLSHALRSLLLAVSMALVLSPILYGIAYALTSAYREVSPLWVIMLVVFLVSLFVYQLHIFLDSIYSKGEGTPRFAERIGSRSGADIYHVGVDDHYLNVLARTGQYRLLMRFADALLELSELDGLRVHRSHWVARAAVRDLVNERGKLTLRLIDGAEVPVSRAYHDVVSKEFEGRV